MPGLGFRRYRSFPRGALALLFVIFSVPRAHAQGTILVEFSIPPDSAFQVGSPVYFDTIVQNTSIDTVRVNMGHHGKWNYEFILLNPDGTTFAVPPYRKIGAGPKGIITVEPGRTRSRRMVFNDWYTIAQPGEYTLKVRLTILLSSSANVSWQKEFFDDMKIVVAPRDPEKLKATCEKLAEAALGTADADAASDASLALSYVVDPLAVPFQARVLKEGSPGARANAVQGLSKIGNREALEALRAGLVNADPDLKAKIESALTQLRPGS
ncbi:MAG: HEAT repeat domain-containing protein [Acidobacteria bacterium]|nr:HEAT repeat domain-containing protein [Acidobacteriota bacterium]